MDVAEVEVGFGVLGTWARDELAEEGGHGRISGMVRWSLLRSVMVDHVGRDVTTPRK